MRKTIIAFFVTTILFLVASSSSAQFRNSLPLYTINNEQFVSLYDVALVTDIEQVFDVISQRGKLYRQQHYAVFQSGYYAVVIDGNIYKSSSPVIRKQGEVFIPADQFRRVIAAFYPGKELVTEKNALSLRDKSGSDTTSDIVTHVAEKPAKDKITFIIIDPGHGGKDPGAIGGSVKEKTLTLAIAKKVRDNLKKNLKGVEVILTRPDDRFLELGTRTEIANKKLVKDKNGLFVSIHVNASISSKSSGYETYFLSQNASNEEARATAALENNVVVLESRKHKPYQDVEYIEALMLTTQIQKDSSFLAEKIQSNMKKNMKQFKSRGVKKANFFVLRGALMPAVLVEVGYITNVQERAALQKSSYQNTIAASVGEGIVDFVKYFNTTR